MQGGDGPRGGRALRQGARSPLRRGSVSEALFELEDVWVRYGDFTAIEGISFDIPAREITALIGPSGCGKSTLLRCLNRMNDLVATATVGGRITYRGRDIYAEDVDPVEIRRRIGMVFQKPNPFPKSVYDNVAFGPRLLGEDDDLGTTVEQALRGAALWDEVNDKLDAPAVSLSGGQQQRLCIARAIATRPDVILMDEPCSSLDPIATLKIEDLMRQLKHDYTMVIVTHNMQQAARVSDYTAFLTVEVDREAATGADREGATGADREGATGADRQGADGADREGVQRTGRLVEFDDTERIFTQATDERTEAYITGRFG